MFPFSSTDHHKLASVKKKKMEKAAGYKMSSSSSSSSDEATVVIDNDQLLLISQFYPDLYTNPLHDQVPKQDESKTRKKRRKRSKGSKEGMETTTTTSNGEMSLMKKRKLSDEQVKMLELNFGNEHKLESERKDRIASELSLDPRQVAVWFQNRRARWKNKRLEEEYSKLKSAYDGITVEKCGLEAEVMKVKEQLSKANKEIERLSQPPPLPPLTTFQLDGIKASRSSTTTVGSPSSSSSSFSMVIDSHFPEDFVVDGFDHSLLYSPAEYNWVNLFGF